MTRVTIFLALIILYMCAFNTPYQSYAKDTGPDDLVGRWERFGDAAEGTVVVVQKVGNTYQAELEKVTGTLLDLGFAKGDLKWKDIVWVSEKSYNGKDMIKFESTGYDYRNSTIKINSQGVLEMTVQNGANPDVIIGSYQTWRKISESSSSDSGSSRLGKKQIILTCGSPYMKVDGKEKEIDPGKGTSPVIMNGRTLLPIRAIIEELGGTVSWDKGKSKVTIKLNTTTLELVIGSNVTLVNGHEIQTDVPAQIINSRTMVPLRFVIDNLGYNVAWDNITKTVTISD